MVKQQNTNRQKNIFRLMQEKNAMRQAKLRTNRKGR